MSPLNCNEKMSPSQDGDLESERVAKDPCDREDGRPAAERERGRRSTGMQSPSGATLEAQLPARFR